MAVRKGCCIGGCLMKTIIAIVIIVVIVGGAIIWLMNQTPTTLKFDDKQINGITIREMGFADTKIKDIIKFLKGLVKIKESDIVDHPFDPIADKASADQALNSIGVPSEGGNMNYLYLIDNVIVTDAHELIEFSDTEIAYMLDAMVQQGMQSEQAEGEEVEKVRQMNAGFSQVKIIKNENVITLEMLVRVDISNIKDDIPNIPFKNSIIPNKVFLNSINVMTIDDEGIISTQSLSLQVNGMSQEMSVSIINALFARLASEGTEENAVAYFNNTFGSLFKLIMNNVGLVGDALTDNSGDVIEDTINYGPQGVTQHKIKVITRTQAPN